MKKWCNYFVMGKRSNCCNVVTWQRQWGIHVANGRVSCELHYPTVLSSFSIFGNLDTHLPMQTCIGIYNQFIRKICTFDFMAGFPWLIDEDCLYLPIHMRGCFPYPTWGIQNQRGSILSNAYVCRMKLSILVTFRGSAIYTH